MTLVEAAYQAYTGNKDEKFEDLPEKIQQAWAAATRTVKVMTEQANTVYMLEDTISTYDHDTLIGPAGKDLEALQAEYELQDPQRKSYARFVEWLQDFHDLKRPEGDVFASNI